MFQNASRQLLSSSRCSSSTSAFIRKMKFSTVHSSLVRQQPLIISHSNSNGGVRNNTSFIYNNNILGLHDPIYQSNTTLQKYSFSTFSSALNSKTPKAPTTPTDVKEKKENEQQLSQSAEQEQVEEEQEQATEELDQDLDEDNQEYGKSVEYYYDFVQRIEDPSFNDNGFSTRAKEYAHLEFEENEFESQWDAYIVGAGGKSFDIGLPATYSPWVASFLSPSALGWDRNDVGRMITLPPLAMRIRAPYVPVHIGKTFDTLRSPSLLLRPQVYELYNLISNRPSVDTGVRLIIEGERGIGKSAALLSLATLLLNDRSSIVVYISGLSDWVFKPTLVTPSYTTEGGYNQNYEAEQILLQLFEAYSDVFATIPVSQDYAFPNKDCVVEGENSLADLMSIGLTTFEMATDVLVALIDELKLVQNYRIVFLVDNYNAAYHPTTAKDSDSKLIKTESLVLVQSIKKLVEHSNEFSNGCFIGATGVSEVQGKPDELLSLILKEAVPVLDFDRLTDDNLNQSAVGSIVEAASKKFEELNDAFKFFDGRRLLKMELAPLTQVETLTLMKYYQFRGWYNKSIDLVSFQMLKSMSANNPLHLYELTKSL